MTGLLCKEIHLLPHAGLLRQASVEPDKRVSTHPALRAQYVVGSQPTPLAELAVRFAGCIGTYQQCQPRFPSRDDDLALRQKKLSWKEKIWLFTTG